LALARVVSFVDTAPDASGAGVTIDRASVASSSVPLARAGVDIVCTARAREFINDDDARGSSSVTTTSARAVSMSVNFGVGFTGRRMARRRRRARRRGSL